MIPSWTRPSPYDALLPGLDPTEYKLHCAAWNGEDHPRRLRALVGGVGRLEHLATRQGRVQPPVHLLADPGLQRARSLALRRRFRGRRARPTPHSPLTSRVARGRLPGASGGSRSRFRLPGRTDRLRFENALDEIEVAEILPLPYAVSRSRARQHQPHAARSSRPYTRSSGRTGENALEHMKGVYVIHDRTSGKPYVGSASATPGSGRAGDSTSPPSTVATSTFVSLLSARATSRSATTLSSRCSSTGPCGPRTISSSSARATGRTSSCPGTFGHNRN